ncbi:MAG: hypothetical protein IPF59_09595 [Ignavibacteria bacterium]|nr:hypothetical protein [Ignavibacteria bacterium]
MFHGLLFSEGTSVARTVLPQITHERSSYLSPGKLTVVRSIGNHRPWVSLEEYLTYKTGNTTRWSRKIADPSSSCRRAPL